MGRPLSELRDQVAQLMRVVPDFPKPGIMFCDIMPLLAHPQIVDDLCESIADYAREQKITCVAALEARGFLFGPQIAIHLGVPFVPIRKQGKLPGPTIQAAYMKEYGEDVLEIQADAVHSEHRVLIIDDLLATGGTLEAAVSVLRKAGAQVCGAFVIVELTSLKGRQRFGTDFQIEAVISYH